MNENIHTVRIISGNDQISERWKPKPSPARILFDPPNQERVLVAYWRGAYGFFDAMVEYIDKNNHLLSRYPVRQDYIDDRLKPLATATPFSQEWLNEQDEQVLILAYLGGRRLTDLQYTLRW